jgi:hypothetical protein
VASGDRSLRRPAGPRSLASFLVRAVRGQGAAGDLADELVTSYVDHWAARLSELPRGAPVPRRLVEQALSLARDLSAAEATDGVMIHEDLHYTNVLAADREPWLAIDPIPMSGDTHYETAPMLWNRMEELSAPSSGQNPGRDPEAGPHPGGRRRPGRGPGA